MTDDERFAELRGLVQEAAGTREEWVALYHLLHGCPRAWFDEVARPYLEAHLARWPDEVREWSIRGLAAGEPSALLARHVSGGEVRGALFAEAVGRPEAARLLSISLRDNEATLGMTGAAALAAATHITDLRALNLHNAFLGDEAGATLVAAPHLASLRTLDLSSTGVGAKTARALADAAHLGALQQLNLSHNDGTISDDEVRALADSAVFARLTALGLNSARLGPAGARAFVEGPWRALERVSLWYNAIGLEGAQALARAPWGDVRELSLYHNGIGDEGLRALLGNPAFQQVHKLELTRNELSDAACHALGEAGWPLRSLGLQSNQITPDGVAALIDSGALQHVESLSLGYNPLDARVVELLASSPDLAHIRTLALNSTGLSRGEVAPITSAPHRHPELRVFV